MLLVTAGAAGAGGVSTGSSSGNKKAAEALRLRDAAVGSALRQLTTGVSAAQHQRDVAVAAANKKAQQAFAGEQPAKTAAAKAQSDYTRKLNSLTGLSTQLSQRESAVTQRENSVQLRENAVAAAERGLQATAFSGNGLFIVGRDIQAGTYQTPGPEDGSFDCYYARLSSTNTSDIIDNNGTDGPNVVTVSPGDVALDVSGCQDFKRIG